MENQLLFDNTNEAMETFNYYSKFPQYISPYDYYDIHKKKPGVNIKDLIHENGFLQIFSNVKLTYNETEAIFSDNLIIFRYEIVWGLVSNEIYLAINNIIGINKSQIIFKFIKIFNFFFFIKRDAIIRRFQKNTIII
jgi:hypothetical protein